MIPPLVDQGFSCLVAFPLTVEPNSLVVEDSFDAMANGGHTSGDAVVGVTVAFTILAVISTCMRLYTRIFMSQMGGVDDFFIAASTVSL